MKLNNRNRVLLIHQAIIVREAHEALRSCKPQEKKQYNEALNKAVWLLCNIPEADVDEPNLDLDTLAPDAERTYTIAALDAWVNDRPDPEYDRPAEEREEVVPSV